MGLDKNSDRPLAVVTGASSGIGYELAKQFAQHGHDLVIVSENAGIVEAAQVCKNLGANVEAYIIDLATVDGVDRLIEKISVINRPIEAVAINTGLGMASSEDDDKKVIQLNITSPIALTKFLLRDMVKRKRGRLIFTTFFESAPPSPLQAVLNASVSFIRSYSESIRQEVRAFGLTVTSLFPEQNESPAVVAHQAFLATINGGKYNTKKEDRKVGTLKDLSEPTKLKH